MKLIKTLPQLMACLPDLPADSHIFLPEAALTALHHDRCQQPDVSALIAPGTRFLVLPATITQRMGYGLWLDVAALRQICADLPTELRQALAAPDTADDIDPQQLLPTLHEHLHAARSLCATASRRKPALKAPKRLPPSADPAAATARQERLRWWARCVRCHDKNNDGDTPTTATRAELDAVERRIGCALPPMLRLWHSQIGALFFVEELLALPDIAPLALAFPGLADILENLPPGEVARQSQQEAYTLIAFGDYLGNGNLWCFHRDDGSIWYFDHDSAPMLTRVFDAVEDYLDALALMALAELHDEDPEDILRQHLGDAVVQKWIF